MTAGKTEITYAQWKHVWNWGELNGYRFDYDGDIGSLKWNNKTETHAQNEPATSVGIYDALVWCNALSEMSGLKPVYYSDAACTQPLKVVHPARALAIVERIETPRDEHTMLCEKTTTHHPAKGWPKVAGFLNGRIFLDPSANGYRLPTNEEWNKLAGSDACPSGANLDPQTAWFIDNSNQRTHPVGTTQPTGAGFHDLAGNVFEWTLEVEEKNGKLNSLIAARGGSHRSDYRFSSSNPLNKKFVAWNSAFKTLNTGIANGEIGFRIVKSAK